MQRLLYKCPICSLELKEGEGSYACNNGHSFDVAKEGYLNLLMVQEKNSKNPGDNREMVSARQHFLGAGYYEKFAEALSQEIKALNPSSLLDVGCGEGYYLEKIQQDNPNIMLYGLDISKDAIRSASKRKQKVKLLVANNYHLPFFDNSFNTILSIFSPVSLEEAARILESSGKLILVGPGPEHLSGLTTQLFGSAIQHEGNFKQIDDSPLFKLISEKDIQYDITVAGEDLINLLKMTPYYWRATIEQKKKFAELPKLKTTVQFCIKTYINL